MQSSFSFWVTAPSHRAIAPVVALLEDEICADLDALKGLLG